MESTSRLHRSTTNKIPPRRKSSPRPQRTTTCTRLARFPPPRLTSFHWSNVNRLARAMLFSQESTRARTHAVRLSCFRGSPHKRIPTLEKSFSRFRPLSLALTRSPNSMVGAKNEKTHVHGHTHSSSSPHLLSNLSQFGVHALPPGFPHPAGAPAPLGHTPAAVNLVLSAPSPLRSCGWRREEGTTEARPPRGRRETLKTKAR